MPTMQKPAPRGDETFPKDENEIKKARANLVKTVHLESIQRRVAQVIQSNPQTVVQELSTLIAQIVSKVIGSIRGKFGSKVHINLVTMLIKLAIDEVSNISKAIGAGPIPNQIRAAIAQGAGDTMDEMMKGGQGRQQGAPQPGQPPPQQGQPPQAPPQQAPQQQQPQGLLGDM